MSELVIRIPGEPHAQGRAKFRVITTKSGASLPMAYDPAASRNWKATAQAHMASAVRKSGVEGSLFTDGPVELQVLAVFTSPKSADRKAGHPRRWHIKKPDGDNVLKAVKDAAKGVLWRDDCQVCDERIVKVVGAQSEAPYLEIRVVSMEGRYPNG
jgi:Holliday junction resolvase RusA-like endonuclease